MDWWDKGTRVGILHLVILHSVFLHYKSDRSAIYHSALCPVTRTYETEFSLFKKVNNFSLPRSTWNVLGHSKEPQVVQLSSPFNLEVQTSKEPQAL